MNDKAIGGFGHATIKGEGMISDPDEYEWKCGCAKCEERYRHWKNDFDVQQAALRNEALDKKAENARELGLDYEPDLQAELDATNRQVEILSDALAESRREVDALVALARADEREACAKVCDTTPPYPFRPSIEAAHAIRARSCPPCNEDCDQGRNCPARKDK